VRNPDTDPEFLPSKFSIRLAPGEVVRVEMAGGGGYGEPLERDPLAVAADLTEEKITVARAREAYGVVLDDEGSVDVAATQHERSTRAALTGEAVESDG
jgi:N-methylhydantoinase B